MTKLTATIFGFTIVLVTSGASLFGNSGPGTPPVAPSIDDFSILPASNALITDTAPPTPVTDATKGDLSSELDDLTLGDDVVGEDYFDNGVSGAIGHGAIADRNRVFGIKLLSMSRANFNDAVVFNPGVSSGDVTLEDSGGLELYMTTRNSLGSGWELRYFSVFDDSASATEASFMPVSFGALRREGEVHNVEVNFLRQGNGVLSKLGLSLDEVIFGVRYFRIDDALDFNTNTAFNYNQSAENSLFGVQVGRRLEKQFGARWGVTGFGKIGIYNNDFDSSLEFDGVAPFRGSKDDVAFLGEFDIALTYLFKQNVRGTLGYRVLGATGVGLAENQSSGGSLPSPVVDTSSDFSLRGGYIGLEFVR